MRKPILWLNPYVSTCPESYAQQEQTAVIELYFSGCRKNNCAACPLVSSTPRYMKDVFSQILYAADQAEKQGNRNLQASLVGGDSLNRWNELRLLLNSIESQTLRIPTTLRATVCVGSLDSEKQDFLLQNTKQLRLTYRWNGAESLNDWRQFGILRHPATSDVDWCLTKDRIYGIGSELSLLLDAGKNVHVEFLDVEQWSSEDLKKYIHEMTKIVLAYKEKAQIRLNPPSCYCGTDKCLGYIELDGRTRPCRHLSTERWIYSTLQDITNQLYLQQGICNADTVYRKYRPQKERIIQIHEHMQYIIFDKSSH